MASRVSVVIPAFNAAATLVAALESVAAQTSRSLEVLVIDDGSSDSSGELAQRFFDRHPDLSGKLFRQANGGASAARALGIASARGAYIALLDSDDAWEPRKLEVSMRCIEELKLDIVGGQLRDRDPNGPDCSLLDRRAMLFRNPYFTSTVVFSRAAYFDVGGFDVSQRHSEDYKLWLAFAWQGKRAGVLNEAFATYRLDGAVRSGLSTQLWRMEKSEIRNYLWLYESRLIGLLSLFAASAFSCAKFLRRLARGRSAR